MRCLLILVVLLLYSVCSAGQGMYPIPMFYQVAGDTLANVIFHDDMSSVVDGHSPTVGAGTVALGSGTAPTVVSGETYFNAITDSGFIYNHNANGIGMLRDSCILDFYYTPNWSEPAGPSTTAYLWSGTSEDGAFQDSNWRLYLYSDDLNLTWNDVILTYDYDADASFTWTADTRYHIQVSMYKNGTAIEYMIFIDGVKMAGVQTTTSNDETLQVAFVLGQKDNNDNEGAQGKIDEFKISTDHMTWE